ncbi:hypothetical protein IWW57_006382, partial [Coemansia sp. S610]
MAMAMAMAVSMPMSMSMSMPMSVVATDYQVLASNLDFFHSTRRHMLNSYQFINSSTGAGVS